MILNSKIRLNDGVEIPRLGMRVYQSSAGESEPFRIVKYALNKGYRHIDTARLYGNEADVDRAVKESGIQRKNCLLQQKFGTATKGITRL